MPSRLPYTPGGGEGYVTLLRLRLRPLEDAKLPPYTGRVALHVASRLGCLRGVWELYKSRGAFRPVTFRALKDERGRPLYALHGSEPHVQVGRGQALAMEVAVYSREPVMPLCSVHEVDLGYTRLEAALTGYSTTSIGTLGRGGYDAVTLTILTPLTITSKIMTPPDLAGRLPRVPEMYRLLPTPGYILAQALRQWIEIVEGRRADPKTYYDTGRIMDILMAEVDYKLRLETILYDKAPDREKLIRGTVGYIKLKILDEQIQETVSRLLELAAYLGLGKSRSIGLGEVRVGYQ